MTIREMKVKYRKHDVFIGLVLAIVIVLSMAVVYVHNEKDGAPAMLYRDEIVSVTRTGGSVSLWDMQTGERYGYTVRGVRREKSAVEAVKTLTETETFTVQSVGNMLIVIEPGNTIYIRL